MGGRDVVVGAGRHLEHDVLGGGGQWAGDPLALGLREIQQELRAGRVDGPRRKPQVQLKVGRNCDGGHAHSLVSSALLSGSVSSLTSEKPCSSSADCHLALAAALRRTM